MRKFSDDFKNFNNSELQIYAGIYEATIVFGSNVSTVREWERREGLWASEEQHGHSSGVLNVSVSIDWKQIHLNALTVQFIHRKDMCVDGGVYKYTDKETWSEACV